MYTALNVLVCLPARARFALLPIMITLIALANLVFLWPIVVTNSWLGWEVFEWPTGSNLTLVVSNAAVSATCIITAMVCAVVSSPLFLAVGGVLQIPLSIASDYLLYGTLMNAVQGIACTLIVAGFLLQVWSDYRERYVTLSTTMNCSLLFLRKFVFERERCQL